MTIVDVNQGALKLVKSVDKQTALPGSVLTYTVLYINLGSNLVKDVVISDPINYNCIFLTGVFPGGKDILWQKPDGSTVHLTAAVDSDEGSVQNDTLYVRMGAALQVLPGVSGMIQYQVRIK